MFFRKICRYAGKEKTEYSTLAQEYLKRNGLLIVQKICDGVLGEYVLEEKAAKAFLGEDYPVAPWLSKKNYIGQCVALLEQAGCIFSCDEKGRVCFKDSGIYKTIVQNHLKMSGRDIVSKLSDACEELNGKISYKRLHAVLGFHYPKAPYISSVEPNMCIILFLKEMGMPFKFDDKYVYFP